MHCITSPGVSNYGAPMNTPKITPHTETRRNAPTVNSRISVVVDVTQAAVDDARAAGLYGVADELDRARRIVAEVAINFWRSEGGER